MLAALTGVTTLRIPRAMRLGDATSADVNAASADYLAGRRDVPMLAEARPAVPSAAAEDDPGVTAA